MKVSVDWLRDWVVVQESAAALGDRLTMAGLELDGLEPAAAQFSSVVVAEIVSTAPHPNADRLRVCRVDVGAGEPLSIVCGAPNARPGIRVPCATVGAVLPGDFRIKRSKLRGEPSEGMLCSARELGLGDAHEGLWELPDEAPLGADLREWLRLDDTVLEIDLTPNRGDCLSVLGIAREVAALSGASLLRVVEAPQVLTEIADTVEVTREASDACPVYCARVVDGLDPAARTPLWLAERLRRAGVRSVAPAVDVTNYVLLELGQPLHAFDADAIEGGLFVRWGREGESLTLLDGQTVEPSAKDLLIADANKPLALAGIMGGAETMVSATTRRIVFESAHFAPQAIAGRARAHGLHTDASHRFERGVDPALPVAAIERATELLQSIAGGQAGPLIVSGAPSDTHAAAPIELRAGRVDALLGTADLGAEAATILQRLGCRVECDDATGTLEVYAPSYRFDLAIEEDLIEEVARVSGYHRLPSRLPSGSAPVDDRRTRLEQALRAELCGIGWNEVVTYSFVAPTLAERFYPAARAARLQNPISAELAVMRPGLWPGLVEVAARNRARGQHDLRVFECGQVFVRPAGSGTPSAVGDVDDVPITAAELHQVERVGGLAMGAFESLHHAPRSAQPVDFFDVKGALEALLKALPNVRFVVDVHPALHPGQSARVERDGTTIGWIGALHPEHARALDLEGCVLWELDLEVLLDVTPGYFTPISPFPAISRDLAVLVAESTAVGEMLASLRALALERPDLHIEQVGLFDVYRGKGVADDHKSVAFRLKLRDFERTLGESDESMALTAIRDLLTERFDAVMRS